MDLLMWFGVLIAALTLLVKSADYFTDGAEKIGLYLGMSSFIVGATIVSIGTSMPEIVTSTMGVLQGKSEFPIDNIIGSNIANILLIGGISGVVAYTLKVKEELIDIDLPFFFFSTALFIFFIHDGLFTWKEGIASLVVLGIFIWYTLTSQAKSDEDKEKIEKFNSKYLLFVLGGMVGIYFGADYTLMSVYKIADILSIPSSIVVIFAVAIGTSLPEIIVSVKAVMNKKHSIALGNIFGSNTFNALAVSGIPAFFGDLTVSPTTMSIGIPFLAIATFGFIFSTMDNKVEKWEAIMMLAVYVIFIGKAIAII